MASSAWSSPASARAGGPDAERAARTAIARAPFRESLRAALLELLMRRGNLAEAMRAYDEIRVPLCEELGTSPGPELVALYDQLLTPAPVKRASKAPGGLLERDAELGEIARRPRAPAGRRRRRAGLRGSRGAGGARGPPRPSGSPPSCCSRRRAGTPGSWSGRAIFRARHASRAKSWLRGAAPWVVGEPWRHYGALSDDEAALHEALALLDGTSARLERAKTHAALGNERLAAQLAAQCGASRLRS